MQARTFCLVCLTYAAMLLGETERAASGAEPCRITFDGNTATQSGIEPTQAETIAFDSGKSQQAAVFGDSARLSYPTAGVYEPTRGTIAMWVQRRWDDTEAATDRILWLMQSDPAKNNLVYLGFRGTGAEGRVYFANKGGADGAVAPVAWDKGDWHHVMACWDDELRVRALYIDGEFQAASSYNLPMPTKAERFYLGHSPNTGKGAHAAIDEVAIYRMVAPDDFLEKTRNTEEARAARQRLAATVARLRDQYSFDRVAKERIEVRWQDLLGIPTPFTQRVPIQVCHHPAIVMVHPDLSITLGRKRDSLVLGFALGSEAEMPDMLRVRRQLRAGCLPIVESRWDQRPITIEQTAFCILPNDARVETGREVEYLVVRMKLTNTGSQPHETTLLALIGQALGTQRTNYRPFVPSTRRWQHETGPWKLENNTLMTGDRVLLRYTSDASVSGGLHTGFLSQDAGPAGRAAASQRGNCLRFPVKLAPEQSQCIDFVVSGTSELYPLAERDGMKRLDYDTALARAEAHWQSLLVPGMKLSTPDDKINAVYKTMILSSLQNLHKNPDRPWHEPDQSCFHANGVWPWEFSQQAVPLASVGYHEQLEPSLRFFTMRQPGVGIEAVDYGPTGDVDSIEGCYIGNCNLYWMCETGAILNAMAAKYLYSGDKQWLEQNRPSILAAWQFIERARDQMRTEDDQGQRPIAYGLLPPGRATDGNDFAHMVGFSDNYTWEGMDRMAKAFTAAGLAEADQFAHDADDYRRCILEAVRRAQFTDADTGYVLIPNTLAKKQAVFRGRVLRNRYSMAMWQTGLLDANDPRFDDAFAWQQEQGGFLMGLCFPMLPVESPFWYVNSIEKGKYMNHLARGEFEKALLVFYTNLIYSMSQDCHQTVERINLEEANYSPFQQNASGNGRMIEMCRRMVIDEQEAGVLWLLRGCPRRWFASGKKIVVNDAPTLFGPMSLATHRAGNEVVVEIDPPRWQLPRELRVVVRHPERKPLVMATIDDEECEIRQETVVIKEPGRARFRLVCRFSGTPPPQEARF